ncbi:Aminopeptidase N [Eumeta japonica]|uniref:Aminopeptidase N n=1 Tax=Eumeta variegata TaxID=151549 RepID=A0A4C1W6A6_EUMVA|nr:Aminopeptidase N [Eumeta japonica]
MLRLYAAVGCVILLSSAVNSDLPLFWDRDLDEPAQAFSTTRDTSYRLPESVIPVEYDVDIEMYFDDLEGKEAYTYDGRVSIIIQAVEENVRQIVLHANVDEILGISLFDDNGVVALNANQPFVVEPQYHFLRVNTMSTLEVGANYTLVIRYFSRMNETPLTRGIWRGRYVDENGVERIYATTHFQPYNARQAFPCWDEPLFKAVFTLHITRPLRYSNVFSNTGVSTFQMLEGDRVRDNFHPTPRMSSYLVTLLVSETFEVIAEDQTLNPPLRIIARSNARGLGDHALNLAVEMTKFFENYFDIPYSDLHPYLFNDHISSPDWASAGTENWGMVSYRELYLIIDKSETIMSIEHYAATLVSHEMAHKWFGNLITCFWWSNTWINEGFASYFGYIATHELTYSSDFEAAHLDPCQRRTVVPYTYTLSDRSAELHAILGDIMRKVDFNEKKVFVIRIRKVFPQYDLHEHFNSRYLQNSLSFDSGTGTMPLNHEVNAPSEVTGHFGTISYSKGAAFLRMMADMITPDTFKKACQIFLRNNQYKATDQYDLYDAFEQAVQEDGTLQEYLHFNFRDYYFTWVDEPGYPILNVEINHGSGEMRLRQERFFLNREPTDQIYPIPITYSTESKPNFEELKPVYMMTTDSVVLTKDPGQEWVIFNNLQHGHYRVNYDDESWQYIAKALVEDIDSINYMNRAQVVDDVFALMRSGRMTYMYGFDILKFLSKEVNYHVWNPAISGFTWLRNRLRHLPESQAIFDAMVLSHMEHVIQTVTYDVLSNETPTVSLTRQEVLHFACMLAHEGCVQNSRTKFLSMKSGEWVDPRIRRNVYVNGIREGDRSDYEFLLSRYSASNFANDQLEMLRALAATKDEATLIQYMDMTLTNEVRPHDKVNAFNYALLGNPESANIVLDYVIDNIEAIRRAYIVEAPSTPVHSCLSNLAAYLDVDGLDKMEEWLETQTGSLEYNSARSAVTSARGNIAWGTQRADDIINAVRGSAAATAASLALITILAAVSLHF